jgi:hypothetical protein
MELMPSMLRAKKERVLYKHTLITERAWRSLQKKIVVIKKGDAI